MLSNDVNLLIQFTNEVLFLIDDLKSTNTSLIFDKKCISFLNFSSKEENIKFESHDYVLRFNYNTLLYL